MVALVALLVGPSCTNANGRQPAPEFTGDVEGAAVAGEQAASRVTVAAAADLRDAFDALTPALERACATRITATYGSSGQLARQVASGAPFALFLSADEGFVVELAALGKVAPGGLARYAQGRLALVAREGLPLPNSVADLADPAYARVAIANPAHAPYGRAARQALENAGVARIIEPRLVFGDNVRQALDYVDSANADAGIVALALVTTRPVGSYVAIDASLHEPLSQAGAVIRGSGAELTARCILARLTEPDAQAVLRLYGFEPPVQR